MGNIIGMLAGDLMSGSSVKQVAKAAGVNEKQAENLMGNAIPLLVQAMSDNAGTKVGAESLYEALGQHSNGLSAAEQLDRADLEDGDRIIGKILGDNKQGVTEALAKQAGVTKGQQRQDTGAAGSRNTFPHKHRDEYKQYLLRRAVITAVPLYGRRHRPQQHADYLQLWPRRYRNGTSHGGAAWKQQ